MESTLLQTKCSCCGKVENETKFKACPTCIELKMLPSVYCCDECFRTDWKSHKKKHNAFANKRTEYLERYQGEPRFERAMLNKEYRRDIKKKCKDGQSSYHNRMLLITRSMIAMDYNRAETLCKKAIEDYPSFPKPYYEMARILMNQNEVNNAMCFLELSMQKICRLLLTAEKKTNVEDKFFLSQSFQCGHFLDIMRWIFIHLKEYVDTVDKCRSSVFIVDWILNSKKFLSLWSYYFDIIKDKNSFDRDQIDRVLHPEFVTSFLQAKRTQSYQEVDPNLSSSPYFDGEWVIAHGLTSSIGKTLNHRVAMVKGDDLHEEGRVAVVFKEGGPTKYVKVENLKHARTVNSKAALLMFLDEPEQWKFMMNNFFSV